MRRVLEAAAHSRGSSIALALNCDTLKEEGFVRRQRAKTQMIHVRIDARLKRSAERAFSEMGISTAEAIRLFLKQVELHRGLPFPVSIPNEETIAAMKEANSPATLRRYRSFREVREQP